jgi:tetratricopeptide (TPR) repeat protein
MSYIHKALNKAQRDKDTVSQEYEGLLSAHGKNKGILSLKAALWISLIVIVCVGSLAYYLWFYPKVQRPAEVMEVKTEAPLPASDRKMSVRAIVPKKAETKYRANPKLLYERARGLQKRGRLKEAKQLYQDVLKADPNYLDALNNLGVIHMHEKNYEAAEGTFKKAIDIMPGHVDSYYNLACICAMRGEKEKGIAHLKKAISLNRAVIDWARADADLQALRGTPEFELLIKPN